MSISGIGVQGENVQVNRLGILAVFSLDDLTVPCEELRMKARAAGLPEEFLPADIRAVDAYRRATADIGDRRFSDKAEPVIVREVVSDKDKTIRILERRKAVSETGDQLVSGNRAKLKYDHIGTITYIKSNETIEYVAVDPEATPYLQAAAKLFLEYRDNYSIEHVRKMIYSAFAKCNAITYRRNGGAAFIPDSYAEPIEKMAILLRDLGCDLDIIQIIDSADHRVNIGKKVEAHIGREMAELAKMLGVNRDVVNARVSLKELVVSFSELLKDKEVSRSKIDSAMNKWLECKALIAEYEKMLEVDMSVLGSEVDIVKAQLGELLTRAD